MELFAPPTITNRYRQLGLNVIHDESIPRLLLNHPDRNNGKFCLPSAKTTSYIFGKVIWIAETDTEGLHGKELDNFLGTVRKAAEAEWVAVPPPDAMHYLDQSAVDGFVDEMRKQGRRVFTYAHAFPNTGKWREIVRSTDAETGIGISKVRPVGLPVLPQVVRSFQDTLGGRYNGPAVVARR
jgi:hypothetical protein